MPPRGWPFPGQDMTHYCFDENENENGGSRPLASTYQYVGPANTQQIGALAHPATEYGLGAHFGIPPALSQPQLPVTNLASLHPPQPYYAGPLLQSSTTGQNSLILYPVGGGGMQYPTVPFADTRQQPFNMAQMQMQMPSQNFFISQNMKSPEMVPQNALMVMPPAASSPGPAQYQNGLSCHADPMLSYDVSVQVPQVQDSLSQTSAIKYRFHIKGMPPFVDLTRGVAPSEKPVLVIKNIPYTITQNEIQQFLAKSLLPHSLSHLTNPDPSSLLIHVVMERGTGKTNDCFIELPSEEIAKICIERVENLVMAGKPPKMGQRIVMIDTSDQGELMKEVFPRAKNILWDTKTGIPVMLKPRDSFCSGFRGFLTSEELNNVVRFAETPQRSPFVIRCQQRTYEMTMSTLAKFPWASIYYTMEQRDHIFKTYFAQLAALLPKVFVEEYGGNHNQRVVGLDARLVASMVDAGLNCPGFNEGQKSDILDLTNQNYAYRGISQYAPAWPFEGLSKPAGADDQDLVQWLSIMRMGAHSCINLSKDICVGDGDRVFVQVKIDDVGCPYTEVTPEGRTKVSFADIARMEKKLMHRMMKAGWEVCYGQELPGMYAETTSVPYSDVEKKMIELRVFELGVDPSEPPLPESVKGAESQVEAQDEANNREDDDATPKPFWGQGTDVPFEDPFHSRSRSIASDSGFPGMHRGIDMTQILPEVNKQAHEDIVSTAATVTTSSIEKPKADYSAALSILLAHPQIANTSARSHTGSAATAIKTPSGREIDFSQQPRTHSVSNIHMVSNPQGAGIENPFLTPRRHSEASEISSTNVSPCTKHTSPKKRYTVNPNSASGIAMDPIGTPFRRSLQYNKINIGPIINENGDGDSITMKGRVRGGSQPFL